MYDNNVRILDLIRFDKCSGYPPIRQKQGLTPFCIGCGDFCHECKYGIAMSSVCGIEQCAKASIK